METSRVGINSPLLESGSNSNNAPRKDWTATCVRIVLFVGGVIGMGFTGHYVHTHEMSGSVQDTGNIIGLALSVFFTAFSLIPDPALQNCQTFCDNNCPKDAGNVY